MKRYVLALSLFVLGIWVGATFLGRYDEITFVSPTPVREDVVSATIPGPEPTPLLPAAASCPTAGHLRTSGSQLFNERGDQVVLAGINWFGFATDFYAPHGLSQRRLGDVLDQVASLGFNTVRLPFTNELFEPGRTPRGIDPVLNPELNGLAGLELMDRLIQAAAERCLKVILDRHRPEAKDQSPLWYTTKIGEERWIADWRMLASRYLGNDTVIGFDLHNEPSGAATWGTGDLATDWRLAAERAGNSILEVNPRLLIIVQGVQELSGRHYWWGGNLSAARSQPVRLSIAGRLVYGPHDYGPGVHSQPWFSDASFPANLPAVWDQFWGYLHKEKIAPVLVGEFGGLARAGDRDTEWQRSLVDYIQRYKLSYCYWALNPNPISPGGLLLADWSTADPAKLAVLQPILQPKLR